MAVTFSKYPNFQLKLIQMYCDEGVVHGVDDTGVSFQDWEEVPRFHAYVTFDRLYRSGGLIDSCSALSVFTTCHSGRLGDA